MPMRPIAAFCPPPVLAPPCGSSRARPSLPRVPPIQRTVRHNDAPRHRYAMTPAMRTGSNGKAATAMEPLAATAAAAAAAVNAAISMRTLEPPDDSSANNISNSNAAALREEHGMDGLPAVYDSAAIAAYWRQHDGALQRRWRDFLAQAVPFLTRVAGHLLRGGLAELSAHSAELARAAREGMETLGPTYIKAGQMLSVRPDVLPQDAMAELAKLQDGCPAFDTTAAFGIVEEALDAPLYDVFSEISDVPVAAASLAQVYKATLRSGETVAVKVQRPQVLQTVSKDLYVLRRAAEVYQGLMDRLAPQQKTDYVALFNQWAVGLYTELDFLNEAANQKMLRRKLAEAGVSDVYIPVVYDHLCSRRVLVSEWVDGVKVSDCEPEEIRELIAIGQECFLTQLLQLGLFHSDPHPGNMLKLTDERQGRLALLDFGLVATLKQEDMDRIISSVIHLANKDYNSLVDDFIALGILPQNVDRPKVLPLMDKALSPYVKGGGAKRYEAELRRTYGMDNAAGGRAKMGGFQAMTRDALTVFNDIPFSIPAYFAILGRAIVTLEGIALQGDEDYSLIREAYPFVARRLLSDDRPDVQRSLTDLLYSSDGGTVSVTRLAAVLNGALGVVAIREGGAFVDLDSLPEEAVSLSSATRLVLGERAQSLRAVLRDIAVEAVDVLVRQAGRKAMSTASTTAARMVRRMPFSFLLPLTVEAADVKMPIVVPAAGGSGRGENGARVRLTSLRELVDASLPKLTRQEELYALSLTDVVRETAGEDLASVVAGDGLTDSRAAAHTLARLTGLLSGVATRHAGAPGSVLPADVLRGVAEVGRAVRAAVGPRDAGGRDAFVGELLVVWEELPMAEREVLREEALGVLQCVWERVLERVQVLR